MRSAEEVKRGAYGLLFWLAVSTIVGAGGFEPPTSRTRIVRGVIGGVVVTVWVFVVAVWSVGL